MKRDTVVIDVGRDFSITPGGRYESEGRWSGEEFRKRLVEPLLEGGSNVIIDLDSATGFTSSFLEEVFGGLIRKYGREVVGRVEPRALAKPSRMAKARVYVERALKKL